MSSLDSQHRYSRGVFKWCRIIVNDRYTAFRPVLSNSYKGITID